MNTKPKKAARSPKTVNLALQSGGAHGAFTWGVLDRLLEEEQLTIEGVTATGAGAVNASVMAYGLITNRHNARKLLEKLWKKISHLASLSPFHPTIVDKMMGNIRLDFSPGFVALDTITRLFSPAQLNVFDINPLRDILLELVDCERLHHSKALKLFINATNVRNGRSKVFHGSELTIDMVLASACLPFIFKTVEIAGESYWDGGYSSYPAISPLLYDCKSTDTVIIQVNPSEVEEVPLKASDIMDRVNEMTFSGTLSRELHSILLINQLIEQGKLTGTHYRPIRFHAIEAGDILSSLGRASKMNADWSFLTYLRDAGRQTANDWLDRHYDAIGVKSSVDGLTL